MTRIFFSAGESSGDIHGSNLIKALRKLDPALECEGLGGQLMASAGMDLRCDLASRAIMGFAEVVRSFGFVRKTFHDTVAHLRETMPDGLVLIDYPGFNMRLAKQAKTLGIPAIYYISPQVWAWKKGRVEILSRLIERMLVILPFEEEIYTRAGVDCVYVGHPLLDHLASVRVEGMFSGPCVIGLMPGSREQEIGRILPTMIEVARGIQKHYPEAQFVTPCVDALRENQVRTLAGEFPVRTVVGGVYEVLSAARFCLVASGTATVETALFKVPMAVMYRVSPVTYWLARMLVRVEAIAMVNILAGKKVVPEFIQGEATADRLLPVALDLIADTPARSEMIEELGRVQDLLGSEGASQAAAREILEVVGRRRFHG